MARRIACHGNSLTLGTQATAGQEYPTVLQGLRPTDTVYNKGFAGAQTSALISGSPTTDYPDIVAPLFAAGAWYVPWEVLNSIFFGASAATAYNDFVTLCGLGRATGYKVLAVTGSKTRGDYTGAMQTASDTANASIRANWATFADALYDPNADSRFADSNNTTYYNADKVHYTDAGYAIIANGVNAALNAALATGGVSRSRQQLCM